MRPCSDVILNYKSHFAYQNMTRKGTKRKGLLALTELLRPPPKILVESGYSFTVALWRLLGVES
jgi:hypothetical protein